MKKRLGLFLALVMAASVVLTACGGGVGGDSTAGGSSTSTGGDSQSTAATGPAEVTLTVTQHDPDESMPGQYLFAWADMVKEKSGGRIEINVNNGGSLAKPTESLDMVKNGTVDLAWGLQSFYPDVFPLTDAIALPMLDLGTGAQAAQAVMDIWLETDLLADEYKDYQVIMIRPSYTSPIATSRKINSIDDFNGMTIRITAKPLINFFSNFGVKSENVPINELYSVMQNGSFDGYVSDWHAIYSFKLEEVSKFIADEKITYTTYYFLMNKDKYNSLDPELQGFIDECSGQNALDLRIDSWDTIVEEGKKNADAAGVETYNLDEATLQTMKDVAEESNQAWIDEYEAKGYRAQEMYDTLIEYSEKYRT